MATARQVWDPERYARNAGFVPELGAHMLEVLDPRPGERILDLGCGDGALTEKLVAAGARVVGIDSSAEQVAAACARGLDARVMNGEELGFDGAFDAVFSNAALHWMPAADKVIGGVWRALASGGRFVGEMGGGHNIATVVQALDGAMGRRGIDADALFPWYFPSAQEYRRRLEDVGFRVRLCALFERPTPLPGDIGDWLATFAGDFLGAVAAGGRPALVGEIREALEPDLCDGEGRWTVDYVRLRFAAIKPDGM